MDEQTNVYVNVSGKVIILNGAGSPLSTNTICPRPGFAKRDAEGNYYFAGVMPTHVDVPSSLIVVDPQDFGGIVLNTWPIYLVKYSPAGTLLWATNFGITTTMKAIVATDLLLDANTNLLVAYESKLASLSSTVEVRKFTANGALVWARQANGPSPVGSTRLTSANPGTNYYIAFNPNVLAPDLQRFDAVGNFTFITNVNSSFDSPNWGRPIANVQGEIYTIDFSVNKLFKRSAPGDILWTVVRSGRTVGEDQYSGVHVAFGTDQLSRYDYDGRLVWTLTLPTRCENLFLDSVGNRFVMLSNGSIVRLGDETLVFPAFTNSPAARTVLAGSNVTFTAGAIGSGPLRYNWLSNNIPISGATNTAFSILAAKPHIANYSIVVSNFLGSVTSAPALLRVKAVQFFLGNQMLTNGTYVFAAPTNLTIVNTFTNGSSFYTANGSPPSFSSTFYTAPFSVSASATFRAIGYSADFSLSEEADSVNFVFPTSYTLSTTSAGGGTIGLSPGGGIYLSNTVVTATASPTNGWSFLYWLGDASGSNASVNVTMNSNKTIQAVFGTTLATTVTGNGQVLRSPATGPAPFGSIVRLTAVPQAGSYFGVWGNAASGTTNPLYFTVTNPSPTVSSLFAPLAEGQAALTVVTTGKGQVSANPFANTYATNSPVTLTATPDGGETFLGWSGDASGTQNPLPVTMTQSKLIVANFSGSSLTLRAVGMAPQGFQFAVGEPFKYYQLYSSTNLTAWTNFGSVSNSAGTVYTDATATNSPAKFYRASE